MFESCGPSLGRFCGVVVLLAVMEQVFTARNMSKESEAIFQEIGHVT